MRPLRPISTKYWQERIRWTGHFWVNPTAWSTFLRRAVVDLMRVTGTMQRVVARPRIERTFRVLFGLGPLRTNTAKANNAPDADGAASIRVAAPALLLAFLRQ